MHGCACVARGEGRGQCVSICRIIDSSICIGCVQSDINGAASGGEIVAACAKAETEKERSENEGRRERMREVSKSAM